MRITRFDNDLPHPSTSSIGGAPRILDTRFIRRELDKLSRAAIAASIPVCDNSRLHNTYAYARPGRRVPRTEDFEREKTSPHVSSTRAFPKSQLCILLYITYVYEKELPPGRGAHIYVTSISSSGFTPRQHGHIRR